MMQLDLDSSIIQPQVQHPQPPVDATFTYMNSDLFKAAEEGNMGPFNKYQGSLHCLVDGRRNTALHIYSRTGVRLVKTYTRFLRFPEWRGKRESISSHFVEQLVDKCPSLLLQPNDKGEIPLHIAIQHGHREIVKLLIERAKAIQQSHEDHLEEATTGGSWVRKMLRMKDNEGNTALHKAAGSGEIEMVQLVVKELDPNDFSSFSANKMGEAPLYIAVKNTWDSRVVAEILEHCKPIDYGGPDGTTALHAAVINDGNTGIMEQLIEAKKELTKETDVKGRTPLHYAVYLGWDWDHHTVDWLLKADASAAYIKDKERGMTALHMAALKCRTRIMEAIISHSPGCCEIVDNRGWNFLHIAVDTLSSKEMKRFLVKGIKNKINDIVITNLLHQKDDQGNTPLQVLISDPSDKDFPLLWEYLYLRRPDFDLSYSQTKKEQIQSVLKDIGNNVEVVGMPVDELRRRMKKMEEEEKEISEREILEKGRETRLLVATLVATVTFAAALTVPGGYEDKKGLKGTAILSGDEAFKAFIVTDTVAFVSSLLAIFVHFLHPSLMKRDRHLLVHWLRLADWLTFLAMVAMVVAFSTGTYAVLKSSMEFAIVTCSLGLVFFPGLLLASYLIFTY